MCIRDSYGSIRDGGRPVAERTPVTIKCGTAPYKGTVDRFGSYKIAVRTTGRCELQVNNLQAEVISYDGPVRYDFEIVRTGGGARLERR